MSVFCQLGRLSDFYRRAAIPDYDYPQNENISLRLHYDLCRTSFIHNNSLMLHTFIQQNQTTSDCTYRLLAKFQHKRSVFQSVGIGRLATKLVATKNVFIFFFLFSRFFFLHRHLFSQKECLDQKTYFAKVDRSAQKPRVRPLSRPRQPFRGPLMAILGFTGDAALQVVSEWPRRRYASMCLTFHIHQCRRYFIENFFKNFGGDPPFGPLKGVTHKNEHPRTPYDPTFCCRILFVECFTMRSVNG